MAKNFARKAADAVGKSGRARSENGLMGGHSRSKHRTPAAVRRQKALEEDPRLRRAREEREAAERQLAALDAQLDGQPHIPYRPEPVDIEETQMPEPKPAVRETKPAPISWSVADARHLIKQGYHVERVVRITGVPVEQLKSLVGADGYARGL